MSSIIPYLIMMVPLAVIFNIPILAVSLQKKLLTRGGIGVAAFLGIFFFIIQPFFWLAMVFFFISASVLSKYKSIEKTSASLDFEKGATKRDAMQVVANGTVALILVVGYGIFDLLPLLLTDRTVIPQITSPFFIGVFIAFAAHNADTWATEIGLLSNRKPRLVTNLKKQVDQGTSGGITIDGLVASLIGAMVIAGVYFSAYLTIPPGSHNIFMIGLAMGVITLAGLIGSVVDSIEGAVIQGIYYCEQCAKETESNPHPRCGNSTTLIRGNIIINNDIVNVSSAFLVAMLGILIIVLIRF
ncbi:MAG: DUF92 domain-containing protein [Candidatus Thorarchaeota archaeon]